LTPIARFSKRSFRAFKPTLDHAALLSSGGIRDCAGLKPAATKSRASSDT
jgi:hypothetical protein